MAERQTEKTLTLAEQYALPKEESSGDGKLPLEAVADASPTNVATEAPAAADVTESPTSVVADEVVKENPTDTASEDAHVEMAVNPTSEKTDETEESSDASEEEKVDEEAPEIKLETAPADFRFPTTNQSRHCFTRYVEYHRCIAAKGDGAPECDKFAKYYRSLCPGEWVDRWNEQRENGTFPGPL